MTAKFFIGGVIAGAAVAWAVYSLMDESNRWTWGLGG